LSTLMILAPASSSSDDRTSNKFEQCLLFMIQDLLGSMLISEAFGFEVVKKDAKICLYDCWPVPFLDLF
jgi:hypothetical protein